VRIWGPVVTVVEEAAHSMGARKMEIGRERERERERDTHTHTEKSERTLLLPSTGSHHFPISP
jgi:hypothetical protein